MRYDMIIVGGGLVGASLAAALSQATSEQSNYKIALIDARVPVNTDARLFALNASSCQFLKNIHVWQALMPHASPIKQVHVSHQGHFGAVRLHQTDVSLEALGYVMPAYLVETAINHVVADLPNVTLYRPATLKTLTQDDTQATLIVEMANREIVLHAPIVIGADGSYSTVRQQLSLPADTVDYDQGAIVTRTTLQRSHHHIAYERFNQRGAIAMLPLMDNECATIWSADQDTISRLMTFTDNEFLNALQHEFGYRLGRLQKINTRHQFPLHMLRTQKHAHGHVFLLGNAAHTLHPIAAQGFNLALYEVAVLVEELVNGVVDLQKIDDKIQAHRQTSIQVSHQLATIFSGRSVMKSCLLQFGMVGLDLATPIKKGFMTRMVGRSGSVPRLLLDAN